MERLITDFLLQDVLSDYTVAAYTLEPADLLIIDKDKSIKEVELLKKVNVMIPLMELKTPWDKPHWRKNPKDLDDLINALFLKATEKVLSSNAVEFSNIESCLPFVRKWFEAKEMSFAYCIMSHNTLLSNSIYLFDKDLYRDCVVIPNFPENTILFTPDPEYIGALPIKHDILVGGFIILDNLLAVEFK